MARTTVPIDIKLAKIIPTFSVPTANLVLPAAVAATPSSVKFNFGDDANPGIKMVGNFAAPFEDVSEKNKCQLEFIQRVTPATFERVYLGTSTSTGQTTFDYASHIKGKPFLDGEGAIFGPAGPAGLFPRNWPKMTRGPHTRFPLAGNDMKNEFVDAPKSATPDFIVAENQEKQFLFSIKYKTTFEAFLVFVHPNNTVVGIAGVKWIAEASYTFRWVLGSLVVVTKSSNCAKTGSMDQAELTAADPFLKDPPKTILVQHANPNLATQLTLPAADGKTFSPTRTISTPFVFFN